MRGTDGRTTPTGDDRVVASVPSFTPRSSSTATTVLRLAWTVAALAALAAALGVFVGTDASSTAYTTIRGELVETYGRGLYEYDSAFKGAGFRGTDVLTLLVGVPFLLIAAAAHRRGRVRGTLLLSGGFAYFLYVYGSLALNAAYNDFFLVYVAIFGLSLFGLVLTLRAVPLDRVVARPRPWLARFLVASGLVTSAIWLSELVPPLMDGSLPDLRGSTTMVTHVLDLALIAPLVIVAGRLVHRGDPLGQLIAIPLLVLEVALLPMIALQTAFQLDAGVDFAPGEIVGPIAGFCVLAALAVVALRSVLPASERSRHVRCRASRRPVQA